LKKVPVNKKPMYRQKLFLKDKESKMATTINIAMDTTSEIDLGNSQAMSITASGGNAEVYVDYKPGSGAYSSAIKGSAGYGNPFQVNNGESKVVNKTDLESENVRVGVRNANISVTY
jgi:hypothetical protein